LMMKNYCSRLELVPNLLLRVIKLFSFLNSSIEYWLDYNMTRGVLKNAASDCQMMEFRYGTDLSQSAVSSLDFEPCKTGKSQKSSLWSKNEKCTRPNSTTTADSITDNQRLGYFVGFKITLDSGIFTFR